MGVTLKGPLEFTIPVAPVTKKNHMQPVLDRQKRFRGLKQSPQYCRYEDTCLRIIPPRVRLVIDEPVNVKATYYMETRRLVDKTNLESALLDVIVKAGVLADDNCKIVVGTDGSRVRYDKRNPRTEVEITPMEDEPYQTAMTMEEDW